MLIQQLLQFFWSHSLTLRRTRVLSKTSACQILCDASAQALQDLAGNPKRLSALAWLGKGGKGCKG